MLEAPDFVAAAFRFVGTFGVGSDLDGAAFLEPGFFAPAFFFEAAFLVGVFSFELAFFELVFFELAFFFALALRAVMASILRQLPPHFRSKSRSGCGDLAAMGDASPIESGG